MNKKIKFIIATTLSILAFLAFQPLQHSSMVTKAYAAVSTYALADRGELKSLEVISTDGKSLELCDDFDGYKKNLTDDKTYYVTLDKKSDGIKIFAESAGEDYVVKVFESDRKNATAHDIGENISLEKGISTLYVRTFTSQEAFKRAEKNETITNCDKTYKININKASINESDDIYIKHLTLNSGDVPINFNKDVLSYDISVDEEQYELTIRVQPKDEENDTIKIDGLKTTGDDDYKRSLPLKKGKNQIKISVIDPADNIRTYTLNVNRGASLGGSANTVSSTTSGNTQTLKINQWIKINDKWQYNDATGAPLKNTWFYDRESGKNYYFQDDGNMAISWLNNNGHWYYLNGSGARQTGWQLINGQWYYFNLEGVMKTGWILDINKKYYYLQENGVMAKNTTVDGYKLGLDGAWIK